MKDQLGMAGKVAVILGGGQGTGEATSHCFAAAGCHVAVVDLDIAKARKVAAEVEAEGVRAVALSGDMRQPAESQRVIEQTTAVLGAPDYLISIIGQATMKPILEMTPEEFDYDLSINYRFLFFAAQAFARNLIEAGKPGAIAAVSSVDGIFGSPVHAAYGSAKAAMTSLVKSAAIEWADHGIRVNAVAPGSVVTPRVQDSEQRRAIMRDSMIPMRRSGQPTEIAGALLFLCSDLASYITGQTLAVDGGWTAANYFNAGRDSSFVVSDNGKKF